MDDGHDLIIGVRQFMSDFYARDIGNKIRHGYRESRKKGLVITPPFGYWKDRNTNCAYQHPEAAEKVTEDDEQGGLRFEIDKLRIGIRLTVPYSPERRAASSQRVKERGISAKK